MCAGGRTGSEGGCLRALRRTGATFFQSVKKASGSSRRMRSTFSSTPPANTIGIKRVILLFRRATATSRPWEGRRSRSMRNKSGKLARNCPTPPPVLSGDASTPNPASLSARAWSRASSGFQQIRRTNISQRIIPCDRLPSMKRLILLTAGLALSHAAFAQVFSFTREQMIKYTPDNPFERFPDGRPKVPDSILERVKTMSIEEAWTELRAKGYTNQYAEGLQALRPGQKLVGRAFTAQYVPVRPDVTKVIDADAKAHGMASGVNQRVIDQLQFDDVPVIDMM